MRATRGELEIPPTDDLLDGGRRATSVGRARGRSASSSPTPHRRTTLAARPDARRARRTSCSATESSDALEFDAAPRPGAGHAGQGPGVRPRRAASSRRRSSRASRSGTGLRRLYVCLTRAVTSLVVCTPAAARRAGGVTRDILGRVDRWPLPGRRRRGTRLLAATPTRPRATTTSRTSREVLDRVDLLAAEARADRTRCGWPRGSTTRSTTPAAAPRSAAPLAQTALASRDPDLVEEVARLVRLTASHRPADGRPERRRALRRRPGDPGRRGRATRLRRRRAPRVRPPLRRDFAPAGRRCCDDLLPSRRLFRTAHGRRGLGARRGPNREDELLRRRVTAWLSAVNAHLRPACSAGAATRRAIQLARRHRDGPGLDRRVVATRRARRSGHGRNRAPGCRARGRTHAARRTTCRSPGADHSRPWPAARRVDDDHHQAPRARRTAESSSNRHDRTKPAST